MHDLDYQGSIVNSEHYLKTSRDNFTFSKEDRILQNQVHIMEKLLEMELKTKKGALEDFKNFINGMGIFSDRDVSKLEAIKKQLKELEE